MMKKVIFTLVTSLIVSATAVAGNYNSLNNARDENGGWFTNYRSVVSKEIYRAVQNDDLLRVNQRSLAKNLEPVFPEIYYAEDAVLADRFFRSTAMQEALKETVEDIACMIYNYRKGNTETSGCNKAVKTSISQKPGGQPQPFYYGNTQKYGYRNTLEKNNMLLTIKANSGNSYKNDRNSIWAPIHELGEVSSRNSGTSSDDLILTLALTVNRIDSNGNVIENNITTNGLAFWVIIPSEKKIENHKSAKQAANFAVKNAKLVRLVTN